MIFAIAGIIGAAYLTLTESGLVKISRFWLSFRENNNTRLAVSWILTFVLIIVYLPRCGGHFAVGGISIDPEDQILDKLFPLGAQFQISEGMGLGIWMCWLLGWTVSLSLMFSLVYTPIAFWDEICRAWEYARKQVRERRELRGDLPDLVQPQQPGQTATTQPSQPSSGFTGGKIWTLLGIEALGETIIEFAKAILRLITGGRL